MSKEEIKLLVEKFSEVYGEPPEVLAAVPGRVNIIGEHVDYSGFPVLPMALDRCVLVAASSTAQHGDAPPTLSIANLDPSYLPAKLPLCQDIEIDFVKEGWKAYFLCGVRGALERLSCGKMRSMSALVSGTVPQGAGLSSSSALVCAAFLTTAHLNKIEVSMKEAAEACASCERYVGTEGGGMDQAIALLATQGCGKLVEFEPCLKATNVSFPNEAVFVVAHSGIIKNKAASSEFNTRVVECRLAAQIIAKKRGLEWRSIRKLKVLVDRLGVSLDEACRLVEEILPQPFYTKQQVCDLLGVDQAELEKECLSHNTLDVGAFKLKQRATHVLKESARVQRLVERCDSLEDMGRLLTESHESLRDLYECSHPRVDLLVRECLVGGALGARITGAGWGGCVVALTRRDHLKKLLCSVKSSFYEDKPCDDLIFPTTPGPGAYLHVLS